MLVKFSPKDNTLDQQSFMMDEVQYNLLHRICEAETSLLVKSVDDKLIFAQTPGFNGWLWINRYTEDSERQQLILELCEYLGDTALLGISAEPRTAGLFANTYSQLHNLYCEIHMKMQSYCCPNVIYPANIAGSMQKATLEHRDIVAEYMAGFIYWGLGSSVDAASQLKSAENTINSGNLYLWLIDGQPVSMANIAHRTPRHARINTVYTPPERRKKGYASALMAELSTLVQGEGLTPMLYTDLKNPDSNKVYKSIGYVECGKIDDIKFVQKS